MWVPVGLVTAMVGQLSARGELCLSVSNFYRCEYINFDNRYVVIDMTNDQTNTLGSIKLSKVWMSDYKKKGFRELHHEYLIISVVFT